MDAINKREIFCQGRYVMMQAEKIGDWFICFDEKEGYKLATFGMGTVCEVRPQDFEMRKLLEEHERLKVQLEAELKWRREHDNE